MEITYEKIHCDVLVIGGGGAGLAAAISAARQGVDVMIVSKGESGKSGATYYDVAEIGAFNAPEPASGDSSECFYEDIERASLGMAVPELSRILADRASETLKYLTSLPGGDAVFERNGEGYQMFQSCFTSKPRAHVMKDHFRPLLEVLRREAVRLGVKSRAGITVAELLVKQGVCYGAYGFDMENHEVVVLAKSVILAAGGAGQLFARNMYPRDVTGDAYALAYRAGARMANMEFVQMGIGVAYPFINLFENYLWECFPRLENGNGECFLEKYLPEGVTQKEVLQKKRGHFPFSVRDCSAYVEIAVQKEINAGKGNHRGNVFLWLDTPKMWKGLNHQNQFSLMWETTRQWYHAKGIDIQSQALEIACFAHAVNGGALIDAHAMTSVDGLYAVGEAAAGPHGADRLGGNMSVASQVFGKIAGEHSAVRAKRMASRPGRGEGAGVTRELEFGFLSNAGEGNVPHSDFWRSLRLPEGVTMEEMKKWIQMETNKSLLIVRNEARLREYIEFLHKLQNRCLEDGNTEKVPTNQMVSLWHMMDTGLLMAQAADGRKESRGSHYREDYPELDTEQGKMNIITKMETE